MVDTELPSSTCLSVKCSWGKIFNSQQGLKMHQLSCRVIKDLSGGTFENQCIDDYLPTMKLAPIIDDQINIKVGELSCLGLMISRNLQMRISNYCCQFMILLRQILIQPSFLCIRLFNNYFEHNFGSMKSIKLLHLEKQYKAYSEHSPKSRLRYLKSSSADPAEIEVVSHILRCRIDATKPTLNEGQVDENIKKNF